MPRRKHQFDPSNAFPGFADVTEIGSGAFASVYRATEIDTNRPVALKMLRPASLRPQVLETFTREMRALAAVSGHPHIVTLFRPFTSPDGHPVLVIELCQESMAQRIRRAGPLPAQEVTSVGIKIAGALESAHRAGFLHRDMKPQNILITQFGEPALADFGVAALQASAQDTEGVFGFTTLHAPPELLQGHQLSAATDVYGLASTMYQLLAGRAPFATFQGEAPASVILRILRDPVEPLQSHAIPYLLSTALESGLAKDPDERPQTAAQFAERLREVEASCGWPQTPYVVWGTSGAADTPTFAPPPAAQPVAVPRAVDSAWSAPPGPPANQRPAAAAPASAWSAPSKEPSPASAWSAPPAAPSPSGSLSAAHIDEPAEPAELVQSQPGPPRATAAADGREPVRPQPDPPSTKPPLVATGPSVVTPPRGGRHVIDPGADPAYRPAAVPARAAPIEPRPASHGWASAFPPPPNSVFPAAPSMYPEQRDAGSAAYGIPAVPAPANAPTQEPPVIEPRTHRWLLVLGLALVAVVVVILLALAFLTGRL